MPAKSQAQFGKMGSLYRQGKISRETLEDFNKGVHPGDLPKKVGHQGSALQRASWRRAAYRRKYMGISKGEKP